MKCDTSSSTCSRPKWDEASWPEDLFLCLLCDGLARQGSGVAYRLRTAAHRVVPHILHHIWTPLHGAHGTGSCYFDVLNMYRKMKYSVCMWMVHPRRCHHHHHHHHHHYPMHYHHHHNYHIVFTIVVVVIIIIIIVIIIVVVVILIIVMTVVVVVVIIIIIIVITIVVFVIIIIIITNRYVATRQLLSPTFPRSCRRYVLTA